MDHLFTSLTALAQSNAATIGELPWGAHAGAALALVAGIALLIAGRRLMRLGLILAAAALGGFFFFYTVPTLGVPADPNLMLAIGIALGAICGLLLYRVTVSLTAMALLATAAPLLAAGVMHLAPSQQWRPTDEELEADAALVAAALNDEAADAALEEAWERVGAFTAQIREKIRAEWGELDGRQKSVLAGSSMLGAALGLLAGMLYPKRCAAVMSAFLGSALILPSSAWLMEAASPAAAAKLPTDAVVWGALWAGLSVVGVVVQWTGTRRKTDS